MHHTLLSHLMLGEVIFGANPLYSAQMTKVKITIRVVSRVITYIPFTIKMKRFERVLQLCIE